MSHHVTKYHANKAVWQLCSLLFSKPRIHELLWRWLYSKPFANSSNSFAEHVRRVFSCLTSQPDLCFSQDSIIWFEDRFLEIPLSILTDEELNCVHIIIHSHREIFSFEEQGDMFLSGCKLSPLIAESIWASDLLYDAVEILLKFARQQSSETLFYICNCIRVTLSILAMSQPVSKRRQVAVQSVTFDFPVLESTIAELHRADHGIEPEYLKLCLRLLSSHAPTAEGVSTFERAITFPHIDVSPHIASVIQSIDGNDAAAVIQVPRIRRIYDMMRVLFNESPGFRARIEREEDLPWTLSFAIRAMPHTFRDWLVTNGRFCEFTRLEHVLFPFIHAGMFQRYVSTRRKPQSPDNADEMLILKAMVVFFSVKHVVSEHHSGQNVVPLRTWLDMFHAIWNNGDRLPETSLLLTNTPELKTICVHLQQHVSLVKRYFSGLACESSLLSGLTQYFAEVNWLEMLKELRMARTDRIVLVPIEHAISTASMAYDMPSTIVHREFQSPHHVVIDVEDNRFLLKECVDWYSEVFGANVSRWKWSRLGGTHVLAVPRAELLIYQKAIVGLPIISSSTRLYCTDGLRAHNLASGNSVLEYSAVMSLEKMFWSFDRSRGYDHPYGLLAPIVEKIPTQSWVRVVSASFEPHKLIFDANPPHHATRIRMEEVGFLHALRAFVCMNRPHYITSAGVNWIYQEMCTCAKLKRINSGAAWTIIHNLKLQDRNITDYKLSLGDLQHVELYKLAAHPDADPEFALRVFMSMHLDVNITLDKHGRRNPHTADSVLWMSTNSETMTRLTAFFKLCRLLSRRLTDITRDMVLEKTTNRSKSPRHITLSDLNLRRVVCGEEFMLFDTTTKLSEYLPQFHDYQLAIQHEHALRSVHWTLPYYLSDQLESGELGRY